MNISRKSLAHNINKKLAIYIILVISVLIFSCFSFVSNLLKEKSLAELIKHTQERAEYESRFFVSAGKSTKFIEEQFFRIRIEYKKNNV